MRKQMQKGKVKVDSLGRLFDHEGHCPDCGSPMERQRFAEVFHEDRKGNLIPNLDEVQESWVCRKCGLRWDGTYLKGQTIVP